MDISTVAGYTTHLCACAVTGKKPKPRPQNIAFNSVFDFASKHMVECSAYRGIEMLSEKPDDCEKWTKHIQQMSAADIVQQIEFERICEKFETDNIGFISVKGFAVKNCYPTTDMRKMSDLDIYVADEEKAHGAMLSLGYECHSYGTCHHNAYFLKPVMNVEIHKSLTSNEKYAPYFDEMCKAILSQSNSCRGELNPAQQLEYMVYHTYKHFSGGGCGIRVVFDIYLYTQAHEDFLKNSDIDIRLKNLGLLKFYKSVMSLGEVWFEDKSPIELDDKLALYFYTSGAYGHTKRRAENDAAAEMNNTENAGAAKSKAVFKLMFPSVSYMKTTFPYVRKCILLLPFAYIHRAFRAIFVNKKTSKLKNAATVSQSAVNDSHELFEELEII